jgi:nitrate/nitrite transporter NarK
VKQCVEGLSGAAFFLYGGFGPFVALVLDLAPLNMRASFSGFVSTGGQAGGFFAPIVIGYIVKATGSFTGGFLFMIAALCVSALCYFALSPYILNIRDAAKAAEAASDLHPAGRAAR